MILKSALILVTLGLAAPAHAALAQAYQAQDRLKPALE
jgi:hypothetical protein